ncbi:hypothetical protein DRW03_10245 [Corallococcus sp. H22C18031201]|uniref:hypothetical protein n=1 Tax=Citreicoccus inhibens TaxID=2849499 RepID=UPI000ECF979A|nr:hypothetical protein [Citreicoccus inhibens]MBU8899333.1 hypothetical protein [Citreicoccus inhibens]RJS23986.1 hypothetical protein DRW03_10245 [Corallococcus sp. H22C18031201]
MTLTTWGLLWLLGSAPGVAAAPVAAEAEGQSQECEQAATRRLGGQTFLFPILQQSAFVTTHVGIREGLARYAVPQLPAGRLGTYDVTLTGFQQTLDLGLRVTPWLGLTGFARANVISGVNAASLVASGASFELLGELGVVGRVLRIEDTGTQLSVRGHFGLSNQRGIQVLPLVNAIVNSPQPTVDSVGEGRLGQLVLLPRTEKTAGGGFFVAQALGTWLSLQASASAEYAWQKRKPFDVSLGTRTEQATHAVRVDLALAAAVDFQPVVHVPVGLMGEYALRTGTQQEVFRKNRTLGLSTLALGLYYTGRPSLQVGLGAVATLSAEPLQGLGPEGRDQESGKPTLTYAQLILRYIW